MERYLIPGVVHACELLRLLAQNGKGMTSQQIEVALDLPRTTVFRLLRTLVSQQMLEKRNKKYFCGADLMNVGLQIINSDRLHQVAIPHVQRLALTTGHTAHLAVPHHGSALIVEVFDSPHPLKVASRPGLRALMHCSSTGKIFLAFLYYDNLELLFENKEMEKRTANTITNLPDLKKELQRVMALGYAVDDKEYHEDVRCLAAPVRDNRGIVVGAIGITGPATSFTKAQIPMIAAQVKAAACDIYKDVYQQHSLSQEKTG
ncbi:IclR family transcriptional regulator [Neptunicella marina]|uniref:IclR family transcriptional regulator n=1 Tax=Neptunicella marina TaxID=2125989 RepID=A0A8J6LYX6_9ALTE|nr:IclR family transcriptional regulator [Neptunicella marina]MBC3765680.1 IclR family transcriptional regulator [Neptunicella marina]